MSDMGPLGPVALIHATPANRRMDGKIEGCRRLGYASFADWQISKAKNAKGFGKNLL